MTREKEALKKGAEEVTKTYAFIHNEEFSCDDMADMFVKGTKWADSHPRKGLVDIEKACKWLIENCPTNDGGELYVFIKDFQKAMEE